jgi:hypothetical protein
VGLLPNAVILASVAPRLYLKMRLAKMGWERKLHMAPYLALFRSLQKGDWTKMKFPLKRMEPQGLWDSDNANVKYLVL